MYTIQASIARRPETVRAQLAQARGLGLHDMVQCLELLLSSSASNDYLEKIAVESIGGVHSSAKLGADGTLPDGSGIEAKPHKGLTKSESGGCINDDTPMKLKRDHESVRTIVFLNASKEGDKINWICAAPFRYWTGPRFVEIAKRLGSDLVWDGTMDCLDKLILCHKKQTYVRSNPLSLSILKNIPQEECAAWVHPNIMVSNLPASIQFVLHRQTSVLPSVSVLPDAPVL
jgi:hypothetical protein